MRKQIACKVVRTIALTKTTNSLVSGDRLHNEHHSSDDAVTVNVWVRYTSNSVVYPGLLDMSRVRHGRIPPQAGLMGQILDCYV
ncbi:MAG: hypothetical protein ACE5NM_02405 [Sedimentisphaerales bacterium]